MRRAVSEAVSGAVAGSVFILLFLVLRYGLISALAISIGVYLGLSILLKPAVKSIRIESTNFTAEDVNLIIRNGKEQVKRIRTHSEKVSDIRVKDNIHRICEVADSIFDDFIKDPKDVRAARKFIDYYLETTQKVVTLYCDLSTKAVYSDNEKRILVQAEQILNQIEQTFHKQLGKLQEDDYMDLATELEVLEMTMKSEGV